MADTFAPFFRQQVTSDEATQWLRTLELADNNMMIDLGFFGILQAAVVTQYLTGDLTVNVSGPAAGYDQIGRRVGWASTIRLNCAVDYNAASTAVVGASNSRYLSIVARFKRLESDPRTDGNGQPVNYSLQESYELLVFAGSEGLSPSPPALPTNGFLLCDILLTFGQTQILNGDIDTSRRQEVLVTPALASDYADHVTGLSDRHTAAMVDGSALNAWADGVTNPSGTVQAQLAAIVDRLRSTVGTGDGAGAKKVGAKTVSGQPYYNLATTTVEGQLGELLAAINDAYGDFGNASGIAVTSPGTWLDGNSALASPANVQAQFAKIVTDLTNVTAGQSGAAKLGATATTHLTGSTIQSMLNDAESKVPWKDAVNTFTAAQTFNNITAGSGSRYKLSSRARTVICLSAPIADAADWARAGDAGRVEMASGAKVFYFPIDPPHNSTLNRIKVFIDPQVAHGAAEPGTGPKIRLFKRDTLGVSAGVFAEVTDGLKSTSYDTAHYIDSGSFSEVVDRNSYRYFVQVTSETGTGAGACDVDHILVSLQVTEQDDAAG